MSGSFPWGSGSPEAFIRKARKKVTKLDGDLEKLQVDYQAKRKPKLAERNKLIKDIEAAEGYLRVNKVGDEMDDIARVLSEHGGDVEAAIDTLVAGEDKELLRRLLKKVAETQAVPARGEDASADASAEESSGDRSVRRDGSGDDSQTPDGGEAEERSSMRDAGETASGGSEPDGEEAQAEEATSDDSSSGEDSHDQKGEWSGEDLASDGAEGESAAEGGAEDEAEDAGADAGVADGAVSAKSGKKKSDDGYRGSLLAAMDKQDL